MSCTALLWKGRFFTAQFFVVLFLCVQEASATSPTSSVGSAVVKKGEFSYELRTGYQFDDANPREGGRLLVRQHIDYGFTDWYAVQIVAEESRRKGEAFDFTGLTIVNRFQIFDKDRHGWDGGVRAAYVFGASPGDPDEIEARLIANVPIGENWAFRHNIILEHEVGDNAADGVMLELRTQMMRDLPVNTAGALKSVSLGAEVFSDFGELQDADGFGDQNHQIGPVMKASWDNGAYLEFGYSAGISDDAPDHNLKLFAGRKF